MVLYPRRLLRPRGRLPEYGHRRSIQAQAPPSNWTERLPPKASRPGGLFSQRPPVGSFGQHRKVTSDALIQNSASSSKVVRLMRCTVTLAEKGGAPRQPNATLGCFSVDDFLRFVDQRIGRKLSLQVVANHLKLSKASFTRGFRQAFGTSFHRYLLRRRIEIAKQLLLDTTYDLSFIGEETGFSSPSHFSSVFLSISGVTPARYRERTSVGRHRMSARSGNRHSSCPVCGQRSSLDRS